MMNKFDKIKGRVLENMNFFVFKDIYCKVNIEKKQEKKFFNL